MKLRQLVLLVLADGRADTALEDALRDAGLDVLHVSRADDAPGAARSSPPDVVLVDAALSRVADAVAAAIPAGTRLLRVQPLRDARGDRGWLLEPDLGVSPPLDARALARRVVAVARPRAARMEPGLVRCGAVRVDVAAHRAFVGARELGLTSLELRLLATVLAGAGRVLSREQLLRDVWGVQARSETRTIDTHMKRLRAKLGDARGVVETVRNVGWRARAAPAPPATTSPTRAAGPGPRPARTR